MVFWYCYIHFRDDILVWPEAGVLNTHCGVRRHPESIDYDPAHSTHFSAPAVTPDQSGRDAVIFGGIVQRHRRHVSYVIV